MMRQCFILLGVLICAVQLFGQDHDRINRVGSAGVSGQYFDVKAYSEDVVYCTNRFGLVVMDVSNPEQPTPANIIPTTANAQGLFLRDSLLFLCDGNEGLRIYDVNDNPFHPREISHTRGPDNARGVQVQGDFAYLWQGGVYWCYIYQISPPAQPELMGRFDFGHWPDIEMNVFGDLMYVNFSNGPTGLWNISDRRQPELITTIDSLRGGETSISLFQEDSILFDCGDLWDYSTPEHPQYISFYDEYGMIQGLKRGHLMYSIGRIYYQNHQRWRYGLLIYDISDPSHPTRHSSVWPEERGNKRVVSDALDLLEGSAYTVERQYGMTVYDVSDDLHPRQAGYYDNRGFFSDIDLTRDFLYAFDNAYMNEHGQACKVRVYSLENPLSPIEIYSFGLDRIDSIFGLRHPYPVKKPKLIGDRLYGLFGSYVGALSLADPGHPEPLFSFVVQNGIGAAFDYAVDGNLVFTGGQYIFVIDNSDYRDPRILSQIYCPYATNGIALDERYLYIYDRMEGLRIYNREDPSNLRLVSILPMEEAMSADQVLLYNDYAYITYTYTINIVDISDRSNPRLVNEINPAGSHILDIKVNEDILFACCTLQGVYAYSLDDPASPQQVGFYDTPGLACMAEVLDGYLYLADSDEIGVYDVGELTGWLNLDFPEQHDFGEVWIDSTAGWDFELVNTGRRYVVIDSLWLEGDASAFDCPLELPLRIEPTDTAFLPLYFQPRADTNYAATLFLRYGEEQTLEVELAGVGKPNNAVADDKRDAYPTRLGLEVSPNPFNSFTGLSFGLPEAGMVDLSIYDLNGRLIQSLVAGELVAGTHTAVWDASAQPSGVYLARLEASGQVINKKMTLVK